MANMWSGVVTDFSFANIHAIFKVCNRMEFIEYLQLSYRIAVGQEKNSPSLITIHLCCAHFMKIVSKDVNLHFKDFNIAILMKDLIAQCVCLKSINSILEWLLNVFVILTSSYCNDDVRNAYDNLTTKYLSEKKLYNEECLFNVIDAETKQFDQNVVMYRASPFYQHFQALIRNV